MDKVLGTLSVSWLSGRTNDCHLLLLQGLDQVLVLCWLNIADEPAHSSLAVSSF